MPLSSGPSNGRVVQTLRDGFWDRTEVVELPDGSRRVRKAHKDDLTAGPWGAEALRREIRLLRNLDPGAVEHFPALLTAWDNGRDLGYEMTYVQGATDVGELAATKALTQPQADAFQDRLAEIVFGRIHRPADPAEPLSQHVLDIVALVLDRLEEDPAFGRVIVTPRFCLNGERVSGPRVASDRIRTDPNLMESLDAKPQVRLHGDLFLENILLPRETTGGNWPAEPTLIDPVSVAGVSQGHPLFDLVKYESYATGELPALRGERLHVEGFDRPREANYVCRVLWDDPAIVPYRRINWLGRFRATYEHIYGPIDWRAYHLLEAYFALVMALCTHGVQRRGRLLKGTWALNAALER